MKIGDMGNNVVSLQEKLTTAGYELEEDGVFGPKTERAVIAFQHSNGLVGDGIVGRKTIARLTRKDNPEYLSHDNMVDAAKKLGIPVAAIMAFNEVESRGQGFIEDRQPAILFERHIMRRRLIHDGSFDVQQLEIDLPGIVNRRTGGYQGGSREHVRLERAKAIDIESAIESASWGLFQILGIHWDRLGYATAVDFEEKMKTSEAMHLDALVRFIKADSRLVAAIQFKEWAKVARIYNGPAFAKNKYDTKLEAAYSRYQALYPET